MQILVLYYSRTGHTKRLAEAVREGVLQSGAECVMRSSSEVNEQDFLDAAGIIAGSPVYFGTLAAELKGVFDRFVGLRRRMEGKVGAAFATSGDATGGKETTLFSILQALMIYGMIVTGDPMEATGHYGVACAGAPGERDLENARALGRRVSGLANKLLGA